MEGAGQCQLLKIIGRLERLKHELSNKTSRYYLFVYTLWLVELPCFALADPQNYVTARFEALLYSVTATSIIFLPMYAP